MIKTLVEVKIELVNKEGKPIDKDNKLIEAGEQSIFVPKKFILLHWGLETELVYDSEKNPIPFTYTVGICQDVETGHIDTFGPKAIKIIGKYKS